MVEWSKSYMDRFGNEWSITTERKRGKPRRVLFTCGEFQLVAFDDEAKSVEDLSATRLKELVRRISPASGKGRPGTGRDSHEVQVGKRRGTIRQDNAALQAHVSQHFA
jgi:hypothetical protein